MYLETRQPGHCQPMLHRQSSIRCPRRLLSLEGLSWRLGRRVLAVVVHMAGLCASLCQKASLTATS